MEQQDGVTSCLTRQTFPPRYKRLREDVFAQGEYVFGDGLSEKQIEESMKRMGPGFEAAAKDLAAKAEVDTKERANHRARMIPNIASVLKLT